MAGDGHRVQNGRHPLIIYGADKDVADWVSITLYGVPGHFGKDAKSIGILLDGKIICGIVYNNFITDIWGNPLCIEMSIASVDKKWANRHTLREAFAYPFIQLNLERVQATTSTLNDGANKMLERLGFQKEGTHRKAYCNRSDAFSWSLLKSECKWI
jgi:RimJ/RimL family protein N-acetyltransferase